MTRSRPALLVTLALLLCAGQPLSAHTNPVIVVEAGFRPGGTVDLSVNLDPRLILSTDPGSLPPPTGAWWLEQSETEKTKHREMTRAYLVKVLKFRGGDTDLLMRAPWKIEPVESDAATPLQSGSAEVHLLARGEGQVAEGQREFKVTLSQESKVPMILLNGMAGVKERSPQAIFPGESSRGYMVPLLEKETPMATASESESKPDRPWKQLALGLLVVGTLVWLTRQFKDRSPRN